MCILLFTIKREKGCLKLCLYVCMYVYIYTLYILYIYICVCVCVCVGVCVCVCVCKVHKVSTRFQAACFTRVVSKTGSWLSTKFDRSSETIFTKD